jgi:uncharacterized Zn-finger protein
MSGSGYLKFRNDRGIPEICIGVREFECIGESPPQDHPHIYISMGAAGTILCPYCGTRFRFDSRLPAAGRPRRARGGQQAPTVSISDGILKAVQAHGDGAAANILLDYLSREFGVTVRPNHLGIALQRHRRAGRLENRDQRW